MSYKTKKCNICKDTVRISNKCSCRLCKINRNLHNITCSNCLDKIIPDYIPNVQWIKYVKKYYENVSDM